MINASDVLPILRTARRRIANPDDWTRGSYAEIDLRPDGFHMRVCSIEALRLTAGVPRPLAMYYMPYPFAKVVDSAVALYASAYQYLTDAIASVGPPQQLIGYNDTHSHAQVLAVWDLAIFNCEAAALAETLPPTYTQPEITMPEPELVNA